MKIGILTFHQSVNNGAVMQAYSSSKKIQELFPNATVEIIDYQMNKVSKELYAYSFKSYFKTKSPITFLKKCGAFLKDPLYLRRMQKRTRVFADCLKKLPLSPETITDDNPNEIVDYINKNYDILVVGSDAVWNYLFRGFPNAYLPGTDIKCKKLSLAASCYGMDFLKHSEPHKEKICENLDDFSFIGVRDTATEDFVKWSGASVPPIHTCDPTAYLDVDTLPIDVQVLENKMRARGFDFSKPTIGIMGNKNMLRMIREMYGDKYQIASLYNHLKGADVNLYDLEPYEWAYVFRYFKLTFTTYFHGTMLSLRNGVPLICIALDTEFAKAHTPKTLDVLTRLGFENWYFTTDYLGKNFTEIKKQADAFLAGDYKNEILTAIDKEAKSFEAVYEALKNIMNEEVEQHD